MAPRDEKYDEKMTACIYPKKDTRADDIKNFLVKGKFKNTIELKPKRNQMKHLTPKKKKRK